MSEKTVFISYRRDATGKAFARALKQALTHRGYDVFLDVDCLDAGQWEMQILTQVPRRAHFLLLLTPGALDRCIDENDWVRREFITAVQHGRNIVPVREDSVILAEMRTACPEPVKSIWDFQVATLQHGGFDGDVEILVTRFIAPHKAPKTTDSESARAPLRPHADISRIIKYAPEDLIGREAETKLLEDAWDQAVRGETGRPHVLTFVALGGEGKTSLVAKWAANLAHREWPGCESVFAWSFYSQGTREQVAASSDLFLKEALTFFGDSEVANSAQGAFDKGRRLAQLVSERRALLILDGVEPLQYAPTPPLAGQLKDQGLAGLLKGLAASNQGLCVVTTRYSLPDLRAFRKGSPLSPRGRGVGGEGAAPEYELPRLSREAGVHLLQSLGVNGSLLENISLDGGGEPVNEFEKLVEDVKGHALTLNLLGTFLRDAHGGDIRRRDLAKLEEADAEEQGGHAFRVMEAYERHFEREGDKGRRALAVLRLLGLFDRPMTADCLAALLKPPVIMGLTEPLVGISETQRNIAFTRLESAKLLTVNRDTAGTLLTLDAHPLLREYFARVVRNLGLSPSASDGQAEGGNTSEAWRAAHRRLYEHLCESTHEGDEPTLEDLEPLYQAVAHGCHAGMHQEACDNVYHARIKRRGENYSSHKLALFGSDLGSIACFFQTPWSRLSGTLMEADQAWLLSEAAYTLRALGRLTEALEPMRAGLEMRIKREDWKNAAISAENISELNLELGKLTSAVAVAASGVEYADKSLEEVERRDNRVVMANAVHQVGRRQDAETRFREAEQMQTERQRAYPLLYSVAGCLYCDLLLALVELAAWQKFVRRPSYGRSLQVASELLEGGTTNTDLLASCRHVSRRASQTLKWASGLSLLAIALDRLTLGRAALYEAILAGTSFDACRASLDPAVSGLRRAGQQFMLPRGLLTRAWFRLLTGARTGPESAQSDLDEAWEIAVRGPMKLHMADVHLYRARLFFREPAYPWDKHPDGSPRGPADDLAAAEQLINECGYHRRDEELADAKAAILGAG